MKEKQWGLYKNISLNYITNIPNGHTEAVQHTKESESSNRPATIPKKSQTSHCESSLSLFCAILDVCKSLHSRHRPSQYSHPDTRNNTNLPLHISRTINSKARRVFRQHWDGESGRARGRGAFGKREGLNTEPIKGFSCFNSLLY